MGQPFSQKTVVLVMVWTAEAVARQARALSYMYGDTENSHLARVMPEFGGEMAEDLVPVEIEGVLTPTPRELAGLLFFLESIQQ